MLSVSFLHDCEIHDVVKGFLSVMKSKSLLSIAGKNGPEDNKPASSKSAHMSPLKKPRESAK